MRRSIVFLAPVTLSLLAVFACDDSSGGSFGTINLDAGNLDVVTPIPTPVADASVADADAAAPGPVSVTVLGSAAAKVGMKIVFGDATGAVLETVATDAAGKATSTTATPPAMATALLKNGSNRFSIVTWTSVAPGDALVIRGLESASTPALVGTYTTTATGYDASTSRIDLEASALCPASTNAPAQPLALGLKPDCVFGATSSVLGHAYFPTTSGTGDYYAFKKNLPLPGASTAVALDAWALPGTATLTVTGIPAGGPPYLPADFTEIASGAPFHRQNRPVDPQLNNSTTFGIVTGFADAYQAAVTVDPYSNDGSHNVVVVRKTGSADITADIGSPLPAIVGGAPTGDPARPTFHWTGDTAATSGGVVQVRFSGGQSAFYSWTFQVPPGATSVTAPALPADAVEFLPIDPSLGGYYAPVYAFVAGPGFTPATLRAAAFASVDVAANGPDDAFLATPMPVDGTYRMSVHRLLDL